MARSDYRVIGVGPDLTEAQFTAILAGAQSPALASAHAVYQYAVARRCSPAFLLAMFLHESSFGKAGTAAITHSWGNTRLPVHGGVVPVRLTTPGEARSGTFPVFRDWVDGGIATVARWLEYAPYAGKTTVGQIIPTWAPPGDQNDTAGYIAAVLASIATWTGTGGTVVPKPPLRIDHTPTKLGGYARGTRRQLMICSHITGGTNSLGWLRDPHPDGKGGDSSPSVNYLIQQDGTIVEIVDPHGPAAWANGIDYGQYPQGKKPNRANPLIAHLTDQQISPNQWTISIEHEGASGGAMTPAQWASTLALQAWLCQEFAIAPDPTHIIGHFEIDSIDRPYCPGWTGDQWDHLQAQIAALLAGQPAAPVADAIAKGVVAPPPPTPLPAGFLQVGQADTFNWDGAGVIVYRKVRYYNPLEKRYYEREWSNSGGYTAWVALS